ncbi:hypothetical protein JCM9534A_00210 [Catenuloplanes indicus JCM 9534]
MVEDLDHQLHAHRARSFGLGAGRSEPQAAVETVQKSGTSGSLIYVAVLVLVRVVRPAG